MTQLQTSILEIDVKAVNGVSLMGNYQEAEKPGRNLLLRAVLARIKRAGTGRKEFLKRAPASYPYDVRMVFFTQEIGSTDGKECL